MSTVAVFFYCVLLISFFSHTRKTNIVTVLRRIAYFRVLHHIEVCPFSLFLSDRHISFLIRRIKVKLEDKMTSYQPPKKSSTLDSTPSVAAEVVADAGNFTLDRVEEFQDNFSRGTCSLRFLAYIGAVAIICVSCYGVWEHLIWERWLAAIFDVYMFFIGIIVIILEYGRQTKSFLAFEETLHRNALFLKYVWGRGVFYLMVGTLEMHQFGFVDILIGAWMCFVGVIFIWWGKKTGQTTFTKIRKGDKAKERRVRRLNILV